MQQAGTGPSPEVLRLTSLSHGAGCACKLSLDELRGVLGALTVPAHAEVVVGHHTGDDAAVWRLSEDELLVATTDFFTPVVDDARTWGRIAAANAVSDVYAMGGTPSFALNIVGWPRALPFEILGEVLAGAQDVATEAGYAVVGGHSIDSAEPLFGQAVIGRTTPDALLTNAGACPGDAVVLTKAIGTGIVMTAVKRSDGPAGEVVGYHDAVASMTRLNVDAARAANACGAHAATDVTGFGLLGHLHRLAEASGVSARVDATTVATLPGVIGLIAAGFVPGGTERNAEQANRFLTPGAARADLAVLCDAQTSGGLLITLPVERVEDLLARLHTTGHVARRIGTIEAGEPGAVHVDGRVGPGDVGP